MFTLTCHLNSILSDYDVSAKDVVIVSDNHQLQPECYITANEERRKVLGRLSDASSQAEDCVQQRAADLDAAAAAAAAADDHGDGDGSVCETANTATIQTSSTGAASLADILPCAVTTSAVSSGSSTPTATKATKVAAHPSVAMPATTTTPEASSQAVTSASQATMPSSSSCSRAAVLAMAIMTPKQTPCRWSGVSMSSSSSLEGLCATGRVRASYSNSSARGRQTASYMPSKRTSSSPSLFKHAVSDSLLSKPRRRRSPIRSGQNEIWSTAESSGSASAQDVRRRSAPVLPYKHGSVHCFDSPSMLTLDQIQEELSASLGHMSSNATATSSVKADTASSRYQSGHSTPSPSDNSSASEARVTFPDPPKQEVSLAGVESILSGKTQSDMDLHAVASRERSAALPSAGMARNASPVSRWTAGSERGTSSNAVFGKTKMSLSHEYLLGSQPPSSRGTMSRARPTRSGLKKNSIMRKTRSNAIF